jgi:hypothetical protein
MPLCPISAGGRKIIKIILHSGRPENMAGSGQLRGRRSPGAASPEEQVRNRWRHLTAGGRAGGAVGGDPIDGIRLRVDAETLIISACSIVCDNFRGFFLHFCLRFSIKILSRI